MSLALPANNLRTDHLTAVENAAATIGLSLPKGWQTDAAEHKKILARSRLALHTPGESVADALVAALADDADPLEDNRVRRALDAERLRAEVANVSTSLRTRERTIVAEHRASIVKALRKPIESAYDALNEVVRLAPTLNSKTPAETVLRHPAEVSAAWTAARDAQSRLRTVTRLLHDLGGWKATREHEHLLHLEPSTNLDRKAMQSEWDAALAGHTLTWCGDAATFRERVTQAAELRSNIDTEVQAKALAERQKQTRPVVEAYAARVAERNAY